MAHDERNRGPESPWGQERSYSSDRPYGDRDYGAGRWPEREGGYGSQREYGFDHPARHDAGWQGEYGRQTDAGWRGDQRHRDTRDYSGVSWGRTGGHSEDYDIRRTGAGLEAGYRDFHRPDAPDWRALQESRAMEYGRSGYGGRYGYDAPHRWQARDAGTEYWRVPGPHTGRGPRGYQRSDDRIREEVSDRLTAHGLIDASDIECKVERGEVLLTGFVDSRAAKRAAEDLADDVTGVREVHNHLRVHPAAPGHDGVGRTSVLGLTEAELQNRSGSSSVDTPAGRPPDPSRSRTRS